MPKTVIRKADSGQAGIFAEILCKSWHSAYSGIIPKDILAKFTDIETRRKALEKWMSGGEAVYLLAYCDDTPCGACCIGACRDADQPKSGEIVAIYLLEEYWGDESQSSANAGQMLRQDFLASHLYRSILSYKYQGSFRSEYQKSPVILTSIFLHTPASDSTRPK